VLVTTACVETAEILMTGKRERVLEGVPALLGCAGIEKHPDFLLNPREEGRHLIKNSVKRKEDGCQRKTFFLKMGVNSPGEAEP
jgi:hypothetical protein